MLCGHECAPHAYAPLVGLQPCCCPLTHARIARPAASLAAGWTSFMMWAPAMFIWAAPCPTPASQASSQARRQQRRKQGSAAPTTPTPLLLVCKSHSSYLHVSLPFPAHRAPAPLCAVEVPAGATTDLLGHPNEAASLQMVYQPESNGSVAAGQALQWMAAGSGATYVAGVLAASMLTGAACEPACDWGGAFAGGSGSGLASSSRCHGDVGITAAWPPADCLLPRPCGAVPTGNNLGAMAGRLQATYLVRRLLRFAQLLCCSALCWPGTRAC